MPAADELIAHPRTFLRANVMMVSSTTANLTAGGEQSFSLELAGGNTARNMLLPNTPAMPVYVLKPYTGAGTEVKAWWCPFAMNDWKGTTLPGVGGSNMMFTYLMDGCTFAAGSRTGNGSVTVHHINTSNAGVSAAAFGEDVAREQQRKLQRNIAKSLVTGAETIDPDDYYDPAKALVPIPPGAKIATVSFGRRGSGGVWKFYTHQWYTVPGARQSLCFIGTQRVI